MYKLYKIYKNNKNININLCQWSFINGYYKTWFYELNLKFGYGISKVATEIVHNISGTYPYKAGQFFATTLRDFVEGVQSPKRRYSTINKKVDYSNENIEEVLKERVEITNNKLDYIIIEDLMSMYKELNYINIVIVRRKVLVYLKENVDKSLRKGYKGIINNKYNKRMYIGVRFKENYKIKDYDNIEINQSKEETLIQIEEDINKIKWTPRNQVKYYSLKMNKVLERLEELSKKIEKLEQKEVEKQQIPNKENKEKIVENTDQKELESIENYDKFFKESIKYTNNNEDLMYSSDLLVKYKENTSDKEKYNFYMNLRNYLIKEYCENDEIKLKSLQFRKSVQGIEKRGYKNMYIKREYSTQIVNNFFKVKDRNNDSILKILKSEENSIEEKEYWLEHFQFAPMDIVEMSVFESEKYNIRLKQIKEILYSEKFLTIGQIKVNEFYRYFPKKLLIELVLIPFILEVVYGLKRIYSLNMLKDKLKDLIIKCIEENKLIKQEHKEETRDYYDIISSYYLELLKNAEIIEYD
jgi:hypothetical protein